MRCSSASAGGNSGWITPLEKAGLTSSFDHDLENENAEAGQLLVKGGLTTL
jgi:hypothetical protein